MFNSKRWLVLCLIALASLAARAQIVNPTTALPESGVTNLTTDLAAKVSTSFYGSNVVGGIVMANAATATGNLAFFGGRYNNPLGTIMPFTAWFDKVSWYTPSALSSSVSLRVRFSGTASNITDPEPQGVLVVGPNSAGGTYQSAALPRYSPVGTVPTFAVDGGGGFNVTNPMGSGLSAEIIGTTSSLLGTWLNHLTVAGSTTAYTGPSQLYTLNANTTENLAKVPIPFAATVRNLCVYPNSAQPAGGNLVITLLQNGSPAGSVAITDASANAYSLCDNHSASLSAGDLIDWRLANASSSASAQINSLSMELVPSGSATALLIFGMGTATVASGSALYWQALAPWTPTTTETGARIPMPRAGVVKNLYCYVTTAPGTNPVTVTVMKNGVATALAVSIATSFSVPGIASDTSDTVSFANLDGIDLSTSQSSGSNPAISSCSVEVD